MQPNPATQSGRSRTESAAEKILGNCRLEARLWLKPEPSRLKSATRWLRTEPGWLNFEPGWRKSEPSSRRMANQFGGLFETGSIVLIYDPPYSFGSDVAGDLGARLEFRRGAEGQDLAI